MRKKAKWFLFLFFFKFYFIHFVDHMKSTVEDGRSSFARWASMEEVVCKDPSDIGGGVH